MTAAHKMRPLHEMYSQDEIDRATACVTRVYENGPDDIEDNPVAGWADFAECSSPGELIEAAIRAVLAGRWYAVNGPQDPDLQPLPRGWLERRESEGSLILVWYARSIAHLNYDITLHPSFYDYACGTLALEPAGSQLLEELNDRFPPRLLPGLDCATGYWSPPTTASEAAQEMGGPDDQ